MRAKRAWTARSRRARRRPRRACPNGVRRRCGSHDRTAHRRGCTRDMHRTSRSITTSSPSRGSSTPSPIASTPPRRRRRSRGERRRCRHATGHPEVEVVQGPMRAGARAPRRDRAAGPAPRRARRSPDRPCRSGARLACRDEYVRASSRARKGGAAGMSDLEELQAGLAHILGSPRVEGRLEMVVRRPAENEQEVLAEARIESGQGMVGDRWISSRSLARGRGDADERAMRRRACGRGRPMATRRRPALRRRGPQRGTCRPGAGSASARWCSR